MKCSFLVGVFVLWMGAADAADDRGDAFAEAAKARIKEQPSVQGDDSEWFFLTKELRHLATGKFWEKSWEEVARNGMDPVPSVVEFAEQLAAKQIRLVVVPIPPKAAIYPEKLDASFEAGNAHSIGPLVEQLLEAGVDVLDLESEFLKARADGDEVLWYCKQDAHVSPAAMERIADLILRNQGLEAVEESPFRHGEPEELSTVGDQVVGTEWEGGVPREVLTIRPVFHDGVRGVEPVPASSVLIMGDSHSLVFHQGEEQGMHCRGAGLVDQLSLRLGTPVSLIGVRGSGLVQARKQLFYHASETPGFWDGVKMVVWIFSVRELTQSRDRIVPIPLSR